MKQVKILTLFLTFGLIINMSSCDKLTTSEPEIYSNYFFINDTSDSLYVDFHYSHKSIADGKIYQGYKSYSLGLQDTISFYFNDILPDFSCADTVWMHSPKMKLKLHDFGFAYTLFYSNKRKIVSKGDNEYTYYFMDDSTLKKVISYYEDRNLLDYYETTVEKEASE